MKTKIDILVKGPSWTLGLHLRDYGWTWKPHFHRFGERDWTFHWLDVSVSWRTWV